MRSLLRRPTFRLLVPTALGLTALAGAAVARGQDDRDQQAQKVRLGLEKELAGLVPGKPSSCLAPGASRSASSRIYGSTIIYQVSSALKYRSDTNVPCGSPNSRPDQDILVTDTPIGRNCAGDPVRVVDRNTGALRGVCSFGPFVPYRRP